MSKVEAEKNVVGGVSEIGATNINTAVAPGALDYMLINKIWETI